jgi:hypothetical protein
MSHVAHKPSKRQRRYATINETKSISAIMAVTSSLKELPPPVPVPDENDNVDDNEQTWDSTFQQDEVLKLSGAPGSDTICSHAVSVGSIVYGCAGKAQTLGRENHDATYRDDDSGGGKCCWWTWQTSLHLGNKSSGSSTNNNAPPIGLVTSIASNSDGSVIAVATNTGTVALLRSLDGKILATRTVCATATGSNDDEMYRAMMTIRISWLGGGDLRHDALLIEVPTVDDDDDDALPVLIVVSNVCGQRLNHPTNAAVVEEAVQRMHIQTLPLQRVHSLAGNNVSGCSYQQQKHQLRTIAGCLMDDDGGNNSRNRIRFVACDSDGKLIAFDYTVRDKNLKLVQANLSLGHKNLNSNNNSNSPGEDEEDWILDFDVGLSTQRMGTKIFVIGTVLSNDHVPNVFWFDPMSLETVCQYAMPRRHSKILALEPVASEHCSTDGGETLAVAVAERSVGHHTGVSEATISVVQLLVDDTMGLVTLRNPHVVYSIPCGAATLSLSLASIPQVPYSFRYKLWERGTHGCIYKEFSPAVEQQTNCIGKIRYLIWNNEFDRAEEMVALSRVDDLVDDPYANFHPSEIALFRLRSSLAQDNEYAMEQARSSLRSLASGALSGNSQGLDLLLEAVNVVTQTPSNLSLQDYLVGLGGLAAAIEAVLQGVHADRAAKLKDKLAEIEKHSLALNFLAKLEGFTYCLATPFNKIRSPGFLFRTLVQERRFHLAEALCRSNVRQHLSSESLLVPLLKLDASVKPEEYLPLINDVVLPNLAINDRLLAHLKHWSCAIADDLDHMNDECGRNLDAAVQLLEVRLR